MPNLSWYTIQERLEEPDQAAKIMIVDDNRPVRHLLGRMLKMNGNKCTLAASAEEARSYISKQNFDLILCDVKMPGESGISFMKYIKSEHPDIAVIMVSGLDHPEVAKAAMEIGSYGYIIKPFGFNEIINNVANALHRRKLEIENRDYRRRLEEKVSICTAEIENTLDRLNKTIQGIIQAKIKL